MFRRCASLLGLSLVMATPITSSGDAKSDPQKENPKWLVEWEYPDAKVEWKKSGNGLFNAVMITTDDFRKVYEHYEGKTCVVNREVTSPDGKTKFRIAGGLGAGGPGGYAVGTASINKELAMKAGIKPEFGRVHFGARDDSLADPSKKEKPNDRSVGLRVTFQDTDEYNVHVVTSRAKDEQHTHIIVTYVRK